MENNYLYPASWARVHRMNTHLNPPQNAIGLRSVFAVEIMGSPSLDDADANFARLAKIGYEGHLAIHPIMVQMQRLERAQFVYVLAHEGAHVTSLKHHLYLMAENWHGVFRFANTLFDEWFVRDQNLTPGMRRNDSWLVYDNQYPCIITMWQQTADRAQTQLRRGNQNAALSR